MDVGHLAHQQLGDRSEALLAIEARHEVAVGLAQHAGFKDPLRELI